MATERLTLHCYDFKVKDEYSEDSKVVIHCWCLDKKSQPHLLRFHDFPAYCYLELPLFIGHKKIYWSGYKAEQVFGTICWKLGEYKPFRYFFKESEKLYYYRGGKRYPMLVLLFNSLKAMYKCKSKLSRPFKVKDLGIVACKVWETKIPLVRKLLTIRNVKYCQWFTIDAIKVVGQDKISKLEHEYMVDRHSMNPIPPEQTSSWMTHPTILSFDIECYSDRSNSFPDAYSSKHVAYMISCVFQRLGDITSRKTDIILYGDCNDTDMANVIRVNSEVEMINKMSDLVNEYDPDILTGYNIFGFDNPYLDTRLKRRLREWKPMGRLINEGTKMTSFSWGSSGYGHNEINMLEMDGRIMIDLYPIIRRDYKLKLYNLAFVSTYFLGKTKHPVTPKQMFESYELHLLSLEIPNKSLKQYTSEQWKKKSEEEIPKRKLRYERESGRMDKNTEEAMIADVYKNTLEEVISLYHLEQYMDKTDDGNIIINIDKIPESLTVKEHSMEEMKKVVDYCVVDSDLVLDLFEKIHCWISLVEMANVVGVTIVELFTRGQQLRVLSQVYDEASRDNIVIDERNVPKMDYSGGFVYEPNPGVYKYIPCLDFKSLYPTVMIANNIDYRTFIPPEMMDKYPDDMCHVIEWDEEITKKVTVIDDYGNDVVEKTPETIHYKFKFIKQEHQLGILPRLLTRLISERDAVRKRQKNIEKGTVEWIVLERRQLAIKISTNSMYGGLGAQRGGKLPLPEAAACITAKSRESIQLVNEYLIKQGHKIVYGDSVTGDTPIYIMKNDKSSFIEIKDLNHSWTRNNNKEYSSVKNTKVWSDKGFTEIKHIMRHKTNKRIYRITTNSGIVTVTEDHSLLDSNSNEIRPIDVKVGDVLLVKKFSNLSNSSVFEQNKYRTQLEAAKRYHELSDYGPTVIYNDGYYIITTPTQIKPRGYVISIDDLGYVDDYVYDLETENHHFSAGVGELVVHNTDSSMPDIGITDPTKAYAMAKKVAQDLSKLFPAPMLVEDEEVYHTMLCIKKKMYLCVKMNKDGTPVLDRDQLKVKGVVPARRDNCQYQRDCFIDTAWKVLLDSSMMETYNFIIDICLKLVQRQVPWKDLVVVKGLGSHYKSKSYCMKVFSDELCKIGKPAMAGDRLEYLIIKSFGVTGKQLLGYKMRLPSTYLERLDGNTPEHIDYVYYMERALMNCIQKQLFQVGYNKQLAELEKKYIESDRQKVLDGLRQKGYGLVVDQLKLKFNNNKEKSIDYLLGTKLKTIVSRLVSYHIKKRSRIVTRVNGEPIKMMVKIIQAKQKCFDVIKSLVPLDQVPKLKNVRLNIVKPTNSGVSKIADAWIRSKTKK